MTDKVFSGDPLRIEADIWNDLMDLRDRFINDPGFSSQPIDSVNDASWPATDIFVKNNSDEAFLQYHLYQLDGTTSWDRADGEPNGADLPEDADNLFLRSILGAERMDPDPTTRSLFPVVVTLEPIAVGKLGRARLSGLVFLPDNYMQANGATFPAPSFNYVRPYWEADEVIGATSFFGQIQQIKNTWVDGVSSPDEKLSVVGYLDNSKSFACGAIGNLTRDATPGAGFNIPFAASSKEFYNDGNLSELSKLLEPAAFYRPVYIRNYDPDNPEASVNSEALCDGWINTRVTEEDYEPRFPVFNTSQWPIPADRIVDTYNDFFGVQHAINNFNKICVAKCVGTFYRGLIENVFYKETSTGDVYLWHRTSREDDTIEQLLGEFTPNPRQCHNYSRRTYRADEFVIVAEDFQGDLWIIGPATPIKHFIGVNNVRIPGAQREQSKDDPTQQGKHPGYVVGNNIRKHEYKQLDDQVTPAQLAIYGDTYEEPDTINHTEQPIPKNSLCHWIQDEFGFVHYGGQIHHSMTVLAMAGDHPKGPEKPRSGAEPFATEPEPMKQASIEQIAIPKATLVGGQIKVGVGKATILGVDNRADSVLVQTEELFIRWDDANDTVNIDSIVVDVQNHSFGDILDGEIVTIARNYEGLWTVVSQDPLITITTGQLNEQQPCVQARNESVVYEGKFDIKETTSDPGGLLFDHLYAHRPNQINAWNVSDIDIHPGDYVLLFRDMWGEWLAFPAEQYPTQPALVAQEITPRAGTTAGSGVANLYDAPNSEGGDLGMLTTTSNCGPAITVLNWTARTVKADTWIAVSKSMMGVGGDNWWIVAEDCPPTTQQVDIPVVTTQP